MLAGHIDHPLVAPRPSPSEATISRPLASHCVVRVPSLRWRFNRAVLTAEVRKHSKLGHELCCLRLTSSGRATYVMAWITLEQSLVKARPGSLTGSCSFKVRLSNRSTRLFSYLRILISSALT